MAFISVASNLVPGDTNWYFDVFVKDSLTGATTRVSTSSAGDEANYLSLAPSISATGRYVAFFSAADNLVPGDSIGSGVFVKDTLTGATSRVSTNSSGEEAGGSEPSISGDGRYVAFESGWINLVPADTNGTRDVFIKDIQTGKTTRVSTSSAGAQFNGSSYFHPSLLTAGMCPSYLVTPVTMIPMVSKTSSSRGRPVSYPGKFLKG